MEDNDTLPPIVISWNVNGKLVSRNLSEDLRVDEEHINEYLTRAPALTAYWNTLFEQQRSVVQKMKVARDRKHAELYKHYKQMRDNDSSRVTNSEIESLIVCDEGYQKIEDHLLECQETELLLKGAVEAIRELRSTLISLSANMRQLGDIKIKRRDVEGEFRKKFHS